MCGMMYYVMQLTVSTRAGTSCANIEAAILCHCCVCMWVQFQCFYAQAPAAMPQQSRCRVRMCLPQRIAAVQPEYA